MPERKIEYRQLEHKADIGFLVTAPSWERLYIDAGLALTDLMVKLDTIKEQTKHNLSVSADNREALMVRWLNELLFLFEKHKFLCRRIVFTKFDGQKIEASAHGETYEPARHGHVSEIKAATYHQLKLGDVAGTESSFFAQVYLDL
jgi:SHS2 domain-containing protein